MSDRVRTFNLSVSPGADFYRNMNVAPPVVGGGAPAFRKGELGAVVPDVNSNRRWQFVQLDSGATSATATGVVADGQLAFWKDRSKYLVTNDATQANAVNLAGLGVSEARNFVAGIFTNAVTANNGTLILQRTDQATGYNVKATGSSWVSGDIAVANTGTAADAVRVAAGTAPTCVVIGTALGAASAGKVPVWVNLPEFD